MAYRLLLVSIGPEDGSIRFDPPLRDGNRRGLPAHAVHDPTVFPLFTVPQPRQAAFFLGGAVMMGFAAGVHRNAAARADVAAGGSRDMATGLNVAMHGGRGAAGGLDIAAGG